MPNTSHDIDPAAFAAKATEVAGVLRALGNPRRLAILCRLAETGEATVGTLAEAVGLGQSALSQHLARMRREGVVAFRRDAQTLWYRIDDRRVAALMTELYRLYCRSDDPSDHTQEDLR